MAAVPVGAPLSELLLSTSEAVDEATLLTCYQAVRTDPPDAVVVNRTGGPTGSGASGLCVSSRSAARPIAEIVHIHRFLLKNSTSAAATRNITIHTYEYPCSQCSSGTFSKFMP